MRSVESTMMGESVFGRICRTMMRRLLEPRARAASTYSCSRMVSTVARSMRALGAMPPMETAMAVCHTPVPSSAETETAISVPGTAMMMSMTRMTIVS